MRETFLHSLGYIFIVFFCSFYLLLNVFDFKPRRKNEALRDGDVLPFAYANYAN